MDLRLAGGIQKEPQHLCNQIEAFGLGIKLNKQSRNGRWKEIQRT